MNLNFRLWAGFFLLPLLSCNRDEPRNTAILAHAPVPMDTLTLKGAMNYDHYFRNAMRETQAIGAAVAIVKDSQIVWLQGYGFRNASTKTPVTPHTVFRIGSLSKGFTGVLSGIMVQRGLLHWDDKVVQYIPAFHLKDKAQGNRVTLKHILSHTTGLPYHAYTNLIEEGFDLNTIVTDYFPQSPVCGKEGEFYAYQNAAFCLSGEMMEQVTGLSFAELIQKNIFTPAGMKDASVTFEAMESMPDKALPHTWTGASWVPQTIETCYYNAPEAGGVNASITDMAQWLKVLLGERPDIVASTTLDEVFTPVVKTGNERRIQRGWIDRDEASYALGWRVIEHQGDTIIYHGGFVNGYRGEIAFDRKKGIGICVLFNGQTPLANDCIEQFFLAMNYKL